MRDISKQLKEAKEEREEAKKERDEANRKIEEAKNEREIIKRDLADLKVTLGDLSDAVRPIFVSNLVVVRQELEVKRDASFTISSVMGGSPDDNINIKNKLDKNLTAKTNGKLNFKNVKSVNDAFRPERNAMHSVLISESKEYIDCIQGKHNQSKVSPDDYVPTDSTVVRTKRMMGTFLEGINQDNGRKHHMQTLEQLTKLCTETVSPLATNPKKRPCQSDKISKKPKRK